MDETRRRITAAAARLHTTVGPAATSIAAVAAEAGVTRLTVYRHFPDLDALFVACDAHWIAQHPPPDPAAWLRLSDLPGRAAVALRELYAWYRANADDLYPIYRDADSMPPGARRRLEADEAGIADALVAGLRSGRRDRRLRAAAGHVTGYRTWRSLAVEQGLTDQEAVELATALLVAAAEDDRHATHPPGSEPPK